MLRIMLAGLVGISLQANAVMAQDIAPLPEAFRDETRGDGDSTLPAIRGVYAHGISGGLALDGVDQDSPLCLGTESENHAVAERLRDRPATEYWFYGTEQQGVLFARVMRVIILPGNQLVDCAYAVMDQDEVERAYVADGYVHSFVFEENTVPGLNSAPVGRSAGQYSGSFDRLTSLMARRDIPRRAGNGWNAGTEAGISVICTGQSGLVWSNTCYATQGAFRGMLMSSGAGDDQQQLFSNRVLQVQDGALPGVVFDVRRDWRLRQD